MSDWKKNAAKRRDEKKLEATGNKRNNKKVKKPWRLQYKLSEPDKVPEFWRPLVKGWRFDWSSLGKYAKESDALKALNSREKNRSDRMFGSSVEYRVVKKMSKEDE